MLAHLSVDIWYHFKFNNLNHPQISVKGESMNPNEIFDGQVSVSLVNVCLEFRDEA